MAEAENEEKLRQAFRNVAGSEQRLNNNELIGVVQVYGLNPTTSEFDSWVKDSARYGIKDMDENEFVLFAKELGLLAKSREEIANDLEQALRTFDKDNQAGLKPSELHEVFTKMGDEQLNDDEADDFIGRFPLDLKGNVPFHDLMELLLADVEDL